ncbi:hypothetical protein ACQP25_26915 [Microtetraspora malaysiensis]|uniref:hypothetical protein n=1 Tax=Microtetraspora malaysiensis TaxID=161358 RepID=UPI003D89BD35
MSILLDPALIGLAGALIGALIGAAAGLVGALGGQRLQARRDRRAQLIDRFISAIGGDPAADAQPDLAKAIREAARVGDRTQVRKLVAAEDAYEIVHALHSILLDAVNTERASGGLKPLELDDIHALWLSREGYSYQRDWENGKPVPKVEPPQSTLQPPAKRRSRK